MFVLGVDRAYLYAHPERKLTAIIVNDLPSHQVAKERGASPVVGNSAAAGQWRAVTIQATRTEAK
jgi:hypothetical protein